MAMKYTKFAPGQCNVLTADICSGLYKSRHVTDEAGCPGVADIGELQPERSGEPVFCICKCHEKPKEA